jgi:uncharacterized protein
MEFDTYTLVLLRRGPRAHEYEGAELDRLQQAHLGHLKAMHERGALLVAGPFDRQEDETFRGLCLYGVPLDEARQLAESDPSVQAGRMAVQAMEWWTEKGALSFR